MREEAERNFGLPAASLGYVGQLVPPIYGVRRAANS